MSNVKEATKELAWAFIKMAKALEQATPAEMEEWNKNVQGIFGMDLMEAGHELESIAGKLVSATEEEEKCPCCGSDFTEPYEGGKTHCKDCHTVWPQDWQG